MRTGNGSHDLVSSAPKLGLQREWNTEDGKPAEQVWEISYSDGRPTGMYLDTQIVCRIKSWAAGRCRHAGQQSLISALPTLVVSGLIKTGKSYTLNEVVPAVLAEALAKEPPEHPLKGIRVLRLNCLDLLRQEGAGSLMYDLLSVVVRWAEAAGVPAKDWEWRQAQAVLADGPNGTAMLTRAGRAVAELFESGFQAPVLVLLDELQALLQPTTIDAGGQERLDRGAVAYIRDVVLRRILVNLPPHVLWVVTGSSMALVWTSLAAMPVNGTAPLNQIRTVHLPSSVPPRLMKELVGHSLRRLGLKEVEQLQEQLQAAGQVVQQLEMDQVKRLVEWSGDSPALFATMLEEWVFGEEGPTDMTTFVEDFINNRMSEEVKEWKLSLAHMSDEDRGRVLDLANTVVGARIDHFPNRGILSFLKPHTRKTEQGRDYLVDPMQRQLLRAVIDRGGKLRESFTGLGAGLTLVQLDWGSLLLQLGEVADYLVRQRRRAAGFPGHVDGAAELAALLEGIPKQAKLPEGNSTADRWEALPAFNKALKSSYNKSSRAWYELEGKNIKLQSNKDYLVFFLWLCRNVLTHHWQQDPPVDILQQVVMALPEMLGMSVQDLAERVRVGMSKLAPATIKAATAAADAEDGDEERASTPGANTSGPNASATAPSASAGSAPSASAPSASASRSTCCSASRRKNRGRSSADSGLLEGGGATRGGDAARAGPPLPCARHTRASGVLVQLVAVKLAGLGETLSICSYAR